MGKKGRKNRNKQSSGKVVASQIDWAQVNANDLLTHAIEMADADGLTGTAKEAFEDRASIIIEAITERVPR